MFRRTVWTRHTATARTHTHTRTPVSRSGHARIVHTSMEFRCVRKEMQHVYLSHHGCGCFPCQACCCPSPALRGVTADPTRAAPAAMLQPRSHATRTTAECGRGNTEAVWNQTNSTSKKRWHDSSFQLTHPPVQKMAYFLHDDRGGARPSHAARMRTFPLLVLVGLLTNRAMPRRTVLARAASPAGFALRRLQIALHLRTCMQHTLACLPLTFSDAWCVCRRWATAARGAPMESAARAAPGAC